MVIGTVNEEPNLMDSTVKLSMWGKKFSILVEPAPTQCQATEFILLYLVKTYSSSSKSKIKKKKVLLLGSNR